MGNDHRLTTPRFVVYRNGEEKPLEVQSINADLVLWDKTRFKHKWPKPDEGPFIWMTFLSWAAARREGLIPPDYTYETWESTVTDIDVPAEDKDDETGTPTVPGPAPG